VARELKEIERDIQALSDEQRFDLSRSLIADLDGPTDADVEEAWLAEAERRDRELESGTVHSIPAEDVFREAATVLAGGKHGG
jgi:hypothetical protein